MVSRRGFGFFRNRRRQGLPPDVLAYVPAPSGGVIDAKNINMTGVQRLVLFLDGLVFDDTGGPEAKLQFYSGGVLQTASYRYMLAGTDSAAGTPSLESGAGTVGSILIGGDVDEIAPQSSCAEIQIGGAGSSSLHTITFCEWINVDPTGAVNRIGSVGLLDLAAAVDGFRIEANAGALLAGQALLMRMPTS